MTIGTIASQAFSPNKIFGLQLWLDASDIATIIQSGGSVSAWNDKSVNGRNGTQIMGVDQPTTNANTLNGKNVISFDGVTEFLDIDHTWMAGSDLTIFMVEVRGSSANELYAMGTAPNATNRALHFGWKSDTNIRLAFFSNDINVTGLPSFSAGTPVLSQGRFSSVDGKFLKAVVNGVAFQATQAGQTTALITADDGTIGAAVNTGFYAGDIAEMVFYDRALSMEETERVEQYLSNKWGLVLP